MHYIKGVSSIACAWRLGEVEKQRKQALGGQLALRGMGVGSTSSHPLSALFLDARSGKSIKQKKTFHQSTFFLVEIQCSANATLMQRLEGLPHFHTPKNYRLGKRKMRKIRSSALGAACSHHFAFPRSFSFREKKEKFTCFHCRSSLRAHTINQKPE